MDVAGLSRRVFLRPARPLPRRRRPPGPPRSGRGRPPRPGCGRAGGHALSPLQPSRIQTVPGRQRSVTCARACNSPRSLKTCIGAPSTSPRAGGVGRRDPERARDRRARRRQRAAVVVEAVELGERAALAEHQRNERATPAAARAPAAAAARGPRVLGVELDLARGCREGVAGCPTCEMRSARMPPSARQPRRPSRGRSRDDRGSRRAAPRRSAHGKKPSSRAAAPARAGSTPPAAPRPAARGPSA